MYLFCAAVRSCDFFLQLVFLLPFKAKGINSSKLSDYLKKAYYVD